MEQKIDSRDKLYWENSKLFTLEPKKKPSKHIFHF